MPYGKKKIDLLYEDLTYEIRGILFEVHRELGRFAKEKQYADLLEKKFIERKIKYKRELIVADSGNIIDFLIEDKVLLEIKAKPFLLKIDYYQLQRYLQSMQIKLGLLVNFRPVYLNPQRVLLAASVDISGSASNQ
jgi:GxxExxY protein